MLNATTTAQLVERVRTLARIFPNRHASCTYLDEYLEPNCIVGHALVQAGIPKITIEKRNAAQISGLDMSILFDALGFVRQPHELEWLNIVQVNQDEGASWAEAVEMADLHV